MIELEIYLKSGAHFTIFVDSFTVTRDFDGNYLGVSWVDTSKKDLPKLLHLRPDEISAVVENAQHHMQADATRELELEDLLTSARAIAERKGDDVAWERFSERLRKAGIGSVTPRTFRVLPTDASDDIDNSALVK